MTTRSTDSSVTDSAAAATAIVTGRKVGNRIMNVADPGNGGELTTLLEYPAGRGRSMGAITMTDVAHATPAAFGAHAASRDDHGRIIDDYLARTRPNVLFGGGSDEMPSGLATEAGYTIVTDRAGLRDPEWEVADPVCGLFGGEHLPYERDGLGRLPHLSG